jgi:hypothetical protein
MRIRSRLKRLSPWRLPPRRRSPGTRYGTAQDRLARRPECPSGWRTGAPDFLVIGAQRAGTTWWFRALTSHPLVRRPPDRWAELHVFDRFIDGWPTDGDIRAYHALFPRPQGHLIGEKTPDYLACHWVPRMLRQAAPDARLIVLLRDPVARYRSAMAMLERRHERFGDRPDYVFRQAIAADQFARGLYARQLRWVFAEWPSDQVLVLQYERCVEDMPGQLARTMAFLGVPPDALLSAPAAHAATGRSSATPIERERTALLVEHYRDDVLELLDLVPDLQLDLWPHFRTIRDRAPAPAGELRAR